MNTSLPEPTIETPRSSGGRGLHFVAHFIGALGVIAVVAGAVQTLLVASAGAGGIANPVFENPRRLPHLEALEHLATGHALSFFLVLPWFVIVVMLAILFAELLHRLYHRSPPAVLTAGLFLAGSVIAGLLAGSSVLKVGEFAVQSTGVTAAEQEWVSAGINFLSQLHLFYVSAWFLSTGLCWLFLGMSAMTPVGAATRNGARLVLLGGLVLVVSVLARSWLPTYGAEASTLMVAMSEPLATFGVGFGFVGCMVLWRGFVRASRAPSDQVFGTS
jgi:hypothetical protein